MSSRARSSLLTLVAAVAMGCSDPSANAVGASQPDASKCIDGDPQRERYGTSCGCCHRDQFSAAGSIALSALAQVDHVEVSDDRGTLLFMSPNPYGNFFGHRPKLTLPARARLFYRDGTVSEMVAPVSDVSCNACHAEAGTTPPIGAAKRALTQ